MAKGPKGMASGLIDPRYCCCAIPLVNAGIYSVILEQGFVSLAIGITAIAAPDVVGTAFPKFATYIFAITCFLIALVQPIGWIGALREKTSTFKAYAWANALAVTAAFSVGAALIVTSAVRHTSAVTACQSDFFTASGNSTSSTFSSAQNSTLTSQGEALCSPFAWADVGIMGGLWVLLFLVQAYFIYLTRTYSTSQVSDHKLYHSVYSENPEAFTMSVLRSTKYNPNSMYSARAVPGPNADAWDARPSMDSVRGGAEPGPSSYYDAAADGNGHGYEYDQHQRAQSYGDDPHGGVEGGQYDDAYAQGSHAYPNTYEGYEQQQQQQQQQQQGYGYGHQHQYSHDQGEQSMMFPDPAPSYVSHPGQAISRDPGGTPTLNNYSDGQGVGWAAGNGGLRRPEDVQHHPGQFASR